jgi:glycosyltransferase involved in cell wall biosynthesis
VRVALAIHRVRPTGGQDRYALELARRLAAHCELDLVAISVEGSLPSSVRVHTLSLPDLPLLAAAPLFRWRAAAALAGRQYDVVHGVGGALPGATVITAQFCAAEWRRLNASADAYQRLVSAQAVRDERVAYGHRRLKAVIAVSRRTAEELRRHYARLVAPITVVPNAVDQELFKPRARAGARPARARLLFVGAYDRKGLDVAIRALALMRSDAELTAIGDGDRARHLKLATEAGVADRVRLEPPRDRIEEAFAAADAFVFPTRYEPYGMVIAEALASGVPVVTTALAGAAELIREGESGFVLADPDDAVGFAAALDRGVGGDAAARARMARSAREAVRDLTWDMVAERTLEVYRAAVDAAR